MGTLRNVALDDPSEVVQRSAETQSKPFYRPELDAVRFLAFFAVYCSHAYKADTKFWNLVGDLGKLGVMLFFVLSAYLITELLRRETLKTGSVDLRKFYLRRVLRIWPLYVLITLIAVLVGAIYTPWRISGGWLLSSIFLTGNWFVVVYGWPASLMVCPLWTISVEEQFYVLVPTLQRVGGVRAVNAASWLFLFVAYSYLWFEGLPHERTLWENSLVMFQFFAAGSLIANYLKGSPPIIKLPYRIVMLVAGLALWMLSNRLGFAVHFKDTATRVTPVYGSLALLAGTLLIFLAFLGATDIKYPRPLLYLGTISYGLYIYHVAILSLMVFLFKPLWSHRGVLLAVDVLSLLATVAVASASYRWIELPFIRYKKRFELVRSKA